MFIFSRWAMIHLKMNLKEWKKNKSNPIPGPVLETYENILKGI